MEGNLRFKIDWASLMVGSKFTVFALFYFLFEGNFSSSSPCGGLYLEGRFNGGFFALPVWGAYFRNFIACGSLQTVRLYISISIVLFSVLLNMSKGARFNF